MTDNPDIPGTSGKRGYELAREALEQARAEARAKGKDVGAGRSGPMPRGKGRYRRRGWTGPGADRWDPETLGSLLKTVAKKRGWNQHVATGQLFAEWPRIVGPEIAAKATPTRLDDGILYVQAESTTWATQLRLYSADILRKIAAAQGPGKVRRLKVEGPSGPSWRKGPLHVRGRGPRDTYG